MIAAHFDQLLWRIPNEIPATEDTKLVDGGTCQIRIRDTGGNRPTLVFFCDPPVTVEAYGELIASLKEEFRVVVAELPGFGFSRTRSVDAASFSGAIDAIEYALTQLSIGPSVLFGPCICGFVVAELARRGKLQTLGVVMMQTPDKPGMLAWVNVMDPKSILRTPVLGQLVLRLNSSRFTNFWFKYASAKHFDSSVLVKACGGALKKGGGYPLATMLQLWPKGIDDTTLEIPGLVIWGRQDKSHAKTQIRCTHAHLPNAELVEFDQCGHFSELEAPQKFAESVRPHLRLWFREAGA